MHRTHARHPLVGWQPVEKAAFGLIYGAIMVLSLLMALGDAARGPRSSRPWCCSDRFWP
jgi:hypothetical protein